MRYSLVKFLLVGIFSNYVISTSIYREQKNAKDSQSNDDQSQSFDDQINNALNLNKDNDIHGNFTSINPKYNNKPIQSILVQLSNSDILKKEELDKIANDLAEKHGLPKPVPIGQLKGYYKFDITGSIRSSLQKRKIKRHIERLNENSEIVSWVDLDRNVKLAKRSISVSDFRDPLAQSQWNLVNKFFYFHLFYKKYIYMYIRIFFKYLFEKKYGNS